MRFTLIAVGTRMPDWVAQGFEEYRKRLPVECALVLKEIPLAPRGKNADLRRALEAEGEQMLSAIHAGDTVVALDVQGRAWTTEALSDQLTAWQMEGCNISLLVGGPDGLSPRCLERASRRWSLSTLTLPHPLVRVVLAEQLYRAWSILQHHPYHRA